MIEICYITDSKNLARCLNFENLMTEDINKREENSNWIGGEYYIQTCILLILEKKFKNNYSSVCLDKYDKNSEKLLDECKIILLPGWTNDIQEENIFYNHRHKLYSYTYFICNFKNIKILTSHNFDENVPALYYYMIPILKEEHVEFNNDIKGMLLGKCISHNINTFDKLLLLLDKLKQNDVKLYSTLRNLKNMEVFPQYLNHIKDHCIYVFDTICKHESLELLGIINPKKFRKLLQHCKYILCLGQPRSPPTIIEALFCNCIIIAPSQQISQDLHNNKNIFLTDNMSNEDIVCLIQKIENDQIMFDKDHYPMNYTEESMEKILNNLILNNNVNNMNNMNN
jgi:hypothetical protein